MRRQPDRARHRLSVPVDDNAVDHVLATPGLNDADKVAILGGNLIKLLAIP